MNNTLSWNAVVNAKLLSRNTTINAKLLSWNTVINAKLLSWNTVINIKPLYKRTYAVRIKQPQRPEPAAPGAVLLCICYFPCVPPSTTPLPASTFQIVWKKIFTSSANERFAA